MTTSPDLGLLARWERTLVSGTQTRAIALLEAFEPEADAHALSVGQRDDALLELLGRSFGEHVEARASCPACRDELELRFSVADVLGDSAASDELTVSEEGYDVRLRLLTGADLVDASFAADTATARALLLERCVVSASHAGEDVAAPDLPPGVVDAIEACIEAADPSADIRLALACPGCGQRFSALFEPAAFVAAELDAYAEQLLYEVHLLAARYGWSEAEILGLSAARRQRYLRMDAA